MLKDEKLYKVLGAVWSVVRGCTSHYLTGFVELRLKSLSFGRKLRYASVLSSPGPGPCWPIWPALFMARSGQDSVMPRLCCAAPAIFHKSRGMDYVLCASLNNAPRMAGAELITHTPQPKGSAAQQNHADHQAAYPNMCFTILLPSGQHLSATPNSHGYSSQCS